ncbi:MAG: cyclic lactone autoinducer peptide [Eubacteriaceae bacterium]
MTEKLSLLCYRAIATLAFMLAFINANSTCHFFVYQPKPPEGFEKLRKYK